ncbi:hypothetical protein NDU88_003972 [Pleurodeles waltl]|uniref:Uncharacterized protein n=1 Tax=Pleurodeles waltl TaxID=8319 RepID=A0AAV7KX33_PLEWA|nr:hypothetical protein NDU88_003972 [Pleurodeles waltl]
MGTGYPDMCFRCKEVGVAGWTHVIATCRCIQGYWDGIFEMLTSMAPVSLSPSIWLMSLGYDPEARLPSSVLRKISYRARKTKDLRITSVRVQNGPEFPKQSAPLTYPAISA